MNLGKALQLAVESAHAEEESTVRESAPFHVPVSDLPDTVRRILREVSYGKSSIAVRSSTKFRFAQPYGDGYQSFAIYLNMVTGDSKVQESAWGGPNRYALDNSRPDETVHKIPMNGGVVSGQRGGGRPVSATLYVNPSNMPKSLPAGDALSEHEIKVMVAFRSYTSAYRKEKLKASDDHVIDSLIARGLLKRNKAGATGITDAGKNAVAGLDRNF